MFTETQLDRYADVLLWALRTARATRFKKDDIVTIRYHQPAIRLAEILHAKTLAQGLNPIPRMLVTPTMEKNLYEIGGETQYTFIPPGESTLCRRLNGSIFLYAPESITHLASTDPKKIGQTLRAHKPLRNILDKREENGHFSWTLCVFPTKALAHHAKLSQTEYTHQIVNACFLNRKSPINEWQRVYRQITEVKRWLDRLPIKRIHIESKHIDLTVIPGDRRKWLGLSGHNIPSFEVFVSPDWRGTNGTYYANQPSYRNGNLVSGVRLVFKDGVVVQAEAQKGDAFLNSQLSIDRGANKVGEFSLTDKRFSRINTFMANTLYDENFGGRYGNCHIALGASYTEAYRGNPKALTRQRKKALGFNDSALHWDLVNSENKRVTAHLAAGKKQTIYENGRFSL